MWKNVIEPNRQHMTESYGACVGVLDNWAYRHTLRICHGYCFSTTTVVMWMCLNVTFVCTLLCCS